MDSARGMTLFEVLIGMTLITVFVSGCILLHATTRYSPALLLARHEHIQTHTTIATTHLFNSREIENRTYTGTQNEQVHEVSISLSNDGILHTIRTSIWRSLFGTEQQLRTESIVANHTQARESACSPVVFGSAKATRLVALTIPELPPLSALAASREFVVTAASSTQPGGPALFLFSYDDSSLSTTPSLTLLDTHSRTATSTRGYRALAISPSHLYALSAETCSNTTPCASLDVFTLTDNTLALQTSIPVHPTRSISIDSNTLYVGLQIHSTAPELQIFDITNPSHPTRVASKEIGYSVHAIAPTADGLIIGTSDNSTAGNSALMQLTYRKSSHALSVIQQTALPGAGIVQHVAVSGGNIFPGRTALLFSPEIPVRSMDSLVATNTSIELDVSITGLLVRGFELFTLTRSHLYRLSTHPLNNGERLSAPLSLPHHMQGVSLVCSQSSLFIGANDTSRGHLFTLSSL